MTQRKMNLAALVGFGILWVVVSGDLDDVSLQREVESLKKVVKSLQDICDFHTSKFKLLQEKSEEQQNTIEKQQKLIEKLLIEDHDFKNKSRNMNIKWTGGVDQKNGNNEEHDINDNTRDLLNYQEGSHEGPLAKDQRNKRLLSQTTPGSPVESAVAFYAYMSTSVAYSNNHHVLVFDTVKTNIGNSFHKSTGVFMVPSSGLYAFTWTIREYNGSEHSVALVINNEEYGAVYVMAHAGFYEQCSTTSVLYLNQGDDVYLRTRNGGGIQDGDVLMISNPWGRTSFSGWKIN